LKKYVQTDNVDQDGLVDIVDFSILASRWNQPIAATLATGADLTGDGVQNSADFQAMQFNYFETGEAIDGCGDGGIIELPLAPLMPLEPMAPIKRGKKEISVNRLMRIAPSAVTADFTNDGMVDVRDIRRFAELNGLQIQPKFDAKLRQMEPSRVEKTDALRR
jgi:hypothetical protein